jgi:multidrug resistance efflux pump
MLNDWDYKNRTFAEALRHAEKSLATHRERLASLEARGEIDSHLCQAMAARLPEFEEKLRLIAEMGEEEWNRRREAAIAASNAFVQRMDAGLNRLWDNPHTTKEDVVQFLTGERDERAI